MACQISQSIITTFSYIEQWQMTYFPSLRVNVRHHRASETAFKCPVKRHLAFNSSVSSQNTTAYIKDWGWRLNKWSRWKRWGRLSVRFMLPRVTSTYPAGRQDTDPQHKPRCCLTGSCHPNDMWADRNSMWLLIWSFKLIEAHWVEWRRPHATVQERLGRINHMCLALLKLSGECSNPAQACHGTKTCG